MKIFIQLIRLESVNVNAWFQSNSNHILKICLVVTIIGSSIYGATIGLWRGPLQAAYVAIKFPLLILITTISNGFLNWLLSEMIGANFTFLRTLKYQFLSYAIASTILLSFVPISLFFLWNTPPHSDMALIVNSILTLIHVLFIAIAGIIANLRLLHILKKHMNSKFLAKTVLITWLAGNMVLGCQISWILRPFIGSPNLAIQFIRPKPLEGNFYIDVYNKLISITVAKE